MTISNNVSFLSQSITQGNRLAALKASMDDLQRQVTSGKNHDSYSGFGTSAQSLQKLHTTTTMTQSYLDNITTATNRMSLMNTTMSKISDLANQLISAVNTGDTTNMASINQVAQQNLSFVEDLMNQQLDGHYLFAGSNVTNQPFVDDSTLNNNFTDQINAWLANPAPTANSTLLNTTDAFNGAQLGLSAGLPASGAVTAHVDANVNIDYTVKADAQPFQDIIRGLTFLANLKAPDPAAGDVATQAQFNAVLGHITSSLSDGVQSMNDMTKNLAGTFSLTNSLKDTHTSDMSLIQNQLDTMENADPSTAIMEMQQLQTQLTASYQVTKIVSEMSLTNFMT